MRSTKRLLSERAKAWVNDTEDDSVWRHSLVAKMRQDGHVYSDDELALIAQGTAELDAFADGTGRVRSFRRSNTATVAQTKFDKASGRLMGRVELVVGASPEHIIASLMHFDSKLNESLRTPELDVHDEVLEVKSPHHTVVFLEKRIAPSFHNRTWLSALLWRKVADAPLTYVWVGVPIKHHAKLPPKREAGSVRADGTRAFRVTHVADGKTKLEYACSLDLRGHFPQWATNSLVIPVLLTLPYQLQAYFLHIRPTSDCTAADGLLLGHLLVDTAEAARKPAVQAITMFFDRTVILRDSTVAFLDELLIAAMGERGHSLLPEAVASRDPAELTVAEAITIGRGFEAIFHASATPSEAVDELLLKYPALDVPHNGTIGFGRCSRRSRSGGWQRHRLG